MSDPSPLSAEGITKASQSNLAFAFVALPREKRRDISIFYAFCRIVDDLADDEIGSLEERRRQLAVWRAALRSAQPAEHRLAAEFRQVLGKYRIDPALAAELITGMEMDLAGARFPTLVDLQLYCYRVAGVVGLISIEIFGYRHPSARDHARALGEALQLTNILRDVGEDYANGGRIYLPLDELARHGYAEADLAAHRHNAAFAALMSEMAARAEEKYTEARQFLAPEDRRSLLPGVLMGDIYAAVLRKMQRDHFHVFGQRYRISRVGKIALLLRRVARTYLF